MSEQLKQWEISADHSPLKRARTLAELAFADFANDRLGMVDRATLRIAEAMEKYAEVDQLPPPPLTTP